MSEFNIPLYMKNSKNYPILSKEEEKELARLVTIGDIQAREKFINSNLRFVIKVANCFKTYCRGKSSIDFEDIVQVGIEGLIKAVERFDPDRGFRFTTYAIWWIKAHIKQYIQENFFLMKISTAKPSRALFFRQQQIKALSNIDVDERDKARNTIAIKAKVSTADVSFMEQRLSEKEIILQGYAYGDKSKLKWEDIIGEKDDIEDNIQSKRLQTIVQKAIDNSLLSDRERDVLQQHFFENITLQSIGNEYNISRERVRQIKECALEKISAFIKDEGIIVSDII